MCLTVSKRHRNIFTGQYKPKKLRKDLTVYKILISEKDMKDHAHTPFFGMTVHFKGGFFEAPGISYEDFKGVEGSVVNDKYVGHTKGMFAYHSYLNKKEALKAMFYFYNNGYFNHSYVTYDDDMNETFHRQFPYLYEAVIPAGSYVYYGNDGGQVASNALTIIQKPRIKVVRGLDNKLSCVYDNPQKYR